MGYSVYITNVSEKEIEKLEKFNDFLEKQNSPCFFTYHNSGIGYCRKNHKKIAGINYCGHYYLAHILVSELCKITNREGFWYDGYEYITVASCFWYRRKREVNRVCRRSMILNREEIRLAKKWAKTLRQIFDEK